MSYSFDALFSFDGATLTTAPPRRPCILLVSHEATRTGAPHVLLWLAVALQELNQFDVRIITRDGGPLVDDFARAAPLCIAAEHCVRLGLSSSDFAVAVAIVLAAQQTPSLAVCNTVVLPEYNEAFARAGVDVMTLVQELPSFFPASTMELIVRTSKYIGIYSEWNRARFTGPYAIPDDKLVFTPPTVRLASRITTTEDRHAARRALGLPDDALIVLGAGYIHLIKGTDLFVQIAARCLHLLSSTSERRPIFCWIGGDADPALRSILAHDIATAGLSDMVSFCGAQADPWIWYRAADVFACTSRWESMSLCVLEAMSSGLPVVTFSEVGASRFVAEDAGRVVPLLDTEAFSRAIVEYLSDPNLRARAGQEGHRRMRLEFGDRRLPPGWKSVLDRLSEAAHPSDTTAR